MGDADEQVPMELEAPRGKVHIHELNAYYTEAFPVELLQRWLSYGKKGLFKRREFVFQKTVADEEGEKTFMARYKSFDDAADLRKGLERFGPDRVELGAVYSHQPKMKERAVGAFEPTERELIFDIDVSDYDDVRVCCKEKKMCDHCWMFMAAGVRTLDSLLRDDFGFEHLMWVFSGRRGVHCWVSDPKARSLTDAQRAAVAKYIEVHVGGRTLEEAKLVVERDLQGGTLHPSLRRLHTTHLSAAFEGIVLEPANPNNLGNPSVAAAVLKIMKPRLHVGGVLERVEGLLAKAVSGDMSPRDAWSGVKQLRVPSRGSERLMEWVTQVVEFMYTYPRLDVGVSTKRNHLLKSVYSIHPGTGLVCVPFRPAELETFRPFRDAPHLRDLRPGAPLPRIELFEEYVAAIEAAAEQPRPPAAATAAAAGQS